MVTIVNNYERTNDTLEKIGKEIVREKLELYNESFCKAQMKRLFALERSLKMDDCFVYIYDFWIYGVSVKKWVCYGFNKLNGYEKKNILQTKIDLCTIAQLPIKRGLREEFENVIEWKGD